MLPTSSELCRLGSRYGCNKMSGAGLNQPPALAGQLLGGHPSWDLECYHTFCTLRRNPRLVKTMGPAHAPHSISVLLDSYVSSVELPLGQCMLSGSATRHCAYFVPTTAQFGVTKTSTRPKLGPLRRWLKFSVCLLVLPPRPPS